MTLKRAATAPGRSAIAGALEVQSQRMREAVRVFRLAHV